MRVLIDANVLMPSILRAILLGAAAAGGFAPLWSARILEEWARAARRRGPAIEAEARAAIAALRAGWPAAEILPPPDLEATLALPDPGDRHVLAAAIAGGAEVLLTRNRADFPPRALARHGVLPRDPDGFLCDLLADGLDLGPVVATVAARTETRPALRPLLKRAGLPRLRKALDPG
ncbi:RSP_2648 family PIN domain-containing protein [Amaricoccus sp.]|uniref:RSP_2648 family PIN domain-containing protein n=1 Tax=Amaricoccus sp. TaxID=1872485 RepID=UPI001B7822F2|nr:PIN domain-containing protein [Amaricoccus sp.]MBP7241629.1 PIN domain-containing protein [Amaricoccus sp.]